MCSSLFHTLISLCVLALVMLARLRRAAVDVAADHAWCSLPLILFVLGLSWALAALGVYLRDLAQTIDIVTTVLMFLSPIFYPASAVPEGFRWAIEWNPMSFFVEQTRAVLICGHAPRFRGPGVATRRRPGVAWLGLALFPTRARWIRRCPLTSSSTPRALAKSYRLYATPRDRLKQLFAGGERKYYREFAALSDVSFDVAARRDGRHHRPQRLRQVDAAADRLRHAAAVRRAR